MAGQSDRDVCDGIRIVGVGASAGGLEALGRMFEKIAVDGEDCPTAFVVIQPLDPDFGSLMNEPLARWTTLKVQQAVDGAEVEVRRV